jgi:hypothetical protein
MPTCVCGAINEADSHFCETCGKPLGSSRTVQSPVKTFVQAQAGSQLRMSRKTLSMLIALCVVVAGLIWWLNRPAPPYHIADSGLYPFIGADNTGTDKMGFINAQGDIVIQPQWDVIDADPIYDQLLFCNEGFCKVRKDGKFGYIDYKGNEVIASQFDNARQFVNGVAAVAVGNQWGYINKSGRYTINPQFDDAGDFLGGYAAVQSEGKWGFINKAGEFKIQPTFAALSKNAFVDGLAAARLKGKIGYIDTAGKFVIPAKFEQAGDFSEGLAQVRLGGKWGYINDSGDLVINTQFEQASGFIGGKAFVSVSGRQGTIDKSGHYVVNPGQFSLNPVVGTAGLLQIKSNDGTGLISRDGSVVVPPSKEISRIVIAFGQVYYVIISDRPVPISTSGEVLAGWYKGASVSTLAQDLQNEKSAVDSMRTLMGAETNYAATHPAVGFTATLGDLGPASDPTDQSHAGLIDATLATGTKDGYQFAASIPAAASSGGIGSNYMIVARPLSGHAGRIFCVDSTKVIHYAVSGQECTLDSARY